MNGLCTITAVTVTMSPWGICRPSQLTRTHAPSVPSLPAGIGAMDIATGPPVGDSGDSSPVVGSTCGLELASEAGELDAEPDVLEFGPQAASSKARTAVTPPNRTILGDFNVTPCRQISGFGG